MTNKTTVPPLVLLHGFTGGPGSWRRVLSQLRSTFNNTAVLTPYLAGHGEHPENLDLAPNTHSFEAEVKRLALVCRRHCEAQALDSTSSFTPAILVGYSLGARISLGLLLGYPELFQSAVLVGVNPGLTTSEARATRQQNDEELAQYADNRGLDAFLNRWERVPLFASQGQMPDTVRSEQSKIRRGNTASGLALSLRTCGLAQMPDYWPQLSSLKHPIHLVAGKRDPRFVEIAQRMAPTLLNASVTLVPECGHNVLLEAPSALCAVIRAAVTSAAT